MEMMDITAERLEEIRRATRAIANPEDKPTDSTVYKGNRYRTTKEEPHPEVQASVS